MAACGCERDRADQPPHRRVLPKNIMQKLGAKNAVDLVRRVARAIIAAWWSGE
jgi:hypothetical protein